MISFTIKKATAIYRLISSFLILLTSLSFAQDDLASFCFSRNVSLNEAKNSMEFLLLPREKVFLRNEDNCFDVVTSPDRAKLLEKFLRLRYNLISETGISAQSEVVEHCQLEFRTTRLRKVDSKNFRVGSTNSAEANSRDLKDVSAAQILLSPGKPGVLDLEGKSLFVECRKGASDYYQLVFSFTELNKAKVTSEITVRKNELLNVAQITNDLNNKSKTLGIPETIYQDAKGQETITYELQIK